MKIVYIKKWWRRKKWHFVVKARNGEVILTSGTYFNFNDMVDTVTLAREGLSTAEIVFKNEMKKD